MLSCVAIAACWVDEADVQRRLGSYDDDPTSDTPSVSRDVTEVDSDVRGDSGGLDEASTPTPSGDDEVEVEVPPPVVDPLACADEQLGRLTGAAVSSGETASWTDDLHGSCHTGTSGGDRTFAWRAPAAGCWRVDTHGSSVDTLLYAYDGCGGAELACHDDSASGTLASSQITLQLAAGEPILWAVDTWSAEAQAGGRFVLNIQSWDVLQGDYDLGRDLGQTISGDNSGADTTVRPSGCPYESARDELVAWTAPHAGAFRATLAGSNFDTVLSVHEPCDPLGLICVDENAPGAEIIEFRAEAGEPVIFRVAGYTNNGQVHVGTWNLRVDAVAP